ncbi:MAG: hypothetical protein R3A52_17780 [Polyangiales bacterium]
MLSRPEAVQFHLGLGRRAGSDWSMLHLAWHRILRDQSLDELRRDYPCPYAVVSLPLDPLVDEALRTLARRVARRYANGLNGPAYGFGEARATFAPDDARLSDPDAAFTCATFVLQMLRSVGVRLVDPERWRAPTPDDLRWQETVGARLVAWIDQRLHGDLLRARERIDHDLGALRFRPADVAGAALLPSDEWPATADAVAPHARFLEGLLAPQ